MKFLYKSFGCLAISASVILSADIPAQANPHYDALRTECDSQTEWTFIEPNACFHRGEGNLIIQSMTEDGYKIWQIFVQPNGGDGSMSVTIVDRNGDAVVSFLKHSLTGMVYTAGGYRELALFIDDIGHAVDIVDYWISESY